MNRTLVAQRITRPQLCVSAVCTALHWPLTYCFMVRCWTSPGSPLLLVVSLNRPW